METNDETGKATEQDLSWLPQYQSHKIVRAVKIQSIGATADPAIEPAALLNHGYPHPPIEVAGWWIKRHRPEPGGYFTMYNDDYTSYSPGRAFEAGNNPISLAEAFGMGKAIKLLWAGKRVARSGWNGKDMWLELQVPDENSKMTLPYIYLNYPDDSINTPGARVPWLASQTDILARDWELID